MSKIVWTSFTILCLLSTVLLMGLSFDIQIVKANGTIEIRLDGSIYPSTAPISSVDKVIYTLTDNITADYDGILVYRDNIVIDGKGYTLHGTGVYYSTGINLMYFQTNATIKNMEIRAFDFGIRNQWSASGINIVENNITNCYYGISLFWSSNYTVIGNNIAKNRVGIDLLSYSSNNTIVGNNIKANNPEGISLWHTTSNNIVSQNIITNNYNGIAVSRSSNNLIFHNILVNNTHQATVFPDPMGQYYANVWDDGYPSGGNFWSDCNGLDLYSGLYQNETGSDGIGDNPYIIAENNQDNYPLMEPYQWVTILGDVNRDGCVDIYDKVIVGAAFGSSYNATDGVYWHQPPDFAEPCIYCPHNPNADINGDDIIDIYDKVAVGYHFGETEP